MGTEYICDFCGFEISSSEYDKLDTNFCPKCGEHIREAEVSKPIVSTDRGQGNPSLITCELCQHIFSRRALKCPKCDWVPIAICEICKNKIPLDSTICIECGDPHPFFVQTNPSPMPAESSASKYVGATLGACTECQKPYDQNFSETENSDDCLNITERERITAEREKQKKSSKDLWLFFIAAILILGYFAKNNVHKAENKRNQSQCLSPISSPMSSPISSPTITNNNVSNETKIVIDEKNALQNSYFGNFKKGKIQKKSGTIKLEVWKPYIQSVNKNIPPQYQSAILSPTLNLNVDFDEIWVWENDEGLSKEEKKKHKGQLDISKLYWKDGKVQANTLEQIYSSNPATGVPLIGVISYQITDIFDRNYILNKLEKDGNAKIRQQDFKTRCIVSAGMTKDEVLKSNCGKPTNIEKDISNGFMTEIWWYDGGTLLFIDGVLKK